MVTQFMANHPLFCNIPQQAIPSILEQLNCRTENFKKGAILCHIGDYVQSMGVVLSGSINIENNDIWGNKNILANITPGQVICRNLCLYPKRGINGNRNSSGGFPSIVDSNWKSAAPLSNKSVFSSVN